MPGSYPDLACADHPSALPWPSVTPVGSRAQMVSPKIPEPERGRNWDLKSVRKADPISLEQSSFEWGLFCFNSVSDSGAIEMPWAWGSGAGLHPFTCAWLCLAPRLAKEPARDWWGRVVLAEVSWTIACVSFSLPPALPETLASPTGGSCIPLREEFPGVWPGKQLWDAEITFSHKLYAFFVNFGLCLNCV